MVGILALQGDFEKHKNVLDRLNVDSLYVKNHFDLSRARALIIPGGESTTLSMLIDRFEMREPLEQYSKEYSIFGTCAGMIMLSSVKNEKIESNVKVLNIMDFSVSRNSWGAQIDSFEKNIDLRQFSIDSFNAVFIRAPKVVEIGNSILRVGYFNQEPVILDDGKHLACSFHPELESDTRLHQYFLDKFYL
tara:strand:- start:1195 stop:1767 length:573 start_codon:yes stop_codon:yes gene_type:complete